MATTSYDLSKLSPRESEVLRLASQGLLDKEIARELGLSLNTLRTYWNRIRLKAGESSRTGLATAFVSEELREQAETSYLPLNLSDAWWEFDAVRSLVRAGNQLGAHVGLPPETWFSLDEYNRLLHPDDLALKLQLISDVAALKQEYVSFTERYLLPEGLVHFHTFGQCFFEGDQFVMAKGHSIPVQSLDAPKRTRIGHWSFSRSKQFDLDADARAIFDLNAEGAVSLELVKERIDPRDRGEFDALLSPKRAGQSDVVSKVFRIKDGDDSPRHIRGVSRTNEDGMISGSFVSMI